jgi:hypothetical protein
VVGEGGVVLPAVDLKTPQAAARSALLTIQAMVRSAAARDRDAENRAEAQLLDIAAQDAILGKLSPAMFQMGSRERILREFVEMWPRALAHYADGFDFDGANAIARSDAAADVYVAADGAKDRTWVEVACVRSGDAWRVASITFAPSRQRAPTSRPH